MVTRAVLAIAMSACAASAPDELQLDTDHETVFECGAPGHLVGEWCFDGEADDLSLRPGVRAPCWPSMRDAFYLGPLRIHRPWCSYCCDAACDAAKLGGCNATSGCMCPPHNQPDPPAIL